jgi:hypothetical protein
LSCKSRCLCTFNRAILESLNGLVVKIGHARLLCDLVLLTSTFDAHVCCASQVAMQGECGAPQQRATNCMLEAYDYATPNDLPYALSILLCVRS